MGVRLRAGGRWQLAFGGTLNGSWSGAWVSRFAPARTDAAHWYS